MQNNKIYTTLANLYGQVKSFIGDTGRSLSEEVDHRIKNHDEVVTARKGYDTLPEKINSIDSSINDVNHAVYNTNARVEKTELELIGINGEIDTIKATTPTIELENGNHLLVNVSNRPSHKEEVFALNTSEQYRSVAYGSHSISQLYVMESVSNKELSMPFKTSNSKYDSIINELKGGALYPNYKGQMKLPLSNMIIMDQVYDNLGSVPGLCDIQAIISAPYLDETNHVVSAFRPGHTWTVKAKMAEIIIEFIKPIAIDKISFDFKANTVQQSVIFYKYSGNKWVEYLRRPASDGYVDINEEIKYMKIGFHSLSESLSTLLEIKDITMTCKEYYKNSTLTSITEPVNQYEMSGQASITPINTIPDHTICKFGLITQSEQDKCLVYYPTRRYIDAGLFINNYNMPVIGKIQSSVKNSYVLDARYEHKNPTGSDGNLTIDSATWSEDTVLTFNDGYKIDNMTYFNLIVKAVSVDRIVPITQSMLNKITTVTLDGVDVAIEVKRVNSSIKVAVRSSKTLASVKCYFYAVQNVSNPTTTNYVRPYTGSTCSISYDNTTKMYSMDTVYYCYKNHYTYKWDTWWGWGYWFSHTSYSGYNTTLKESLIFVDCDNVHSNLCRSERTTYTSYKRDAYILDNVSSTVLYVGPNQSVFDAFIKDGNIIPSTTTSRVSTANEFVSSLKIDPSQKITKIETSQQATSANDVEYFLSPNNYSFYTYSNETNSWNQTSKGMSAYEIEKVPTHAFEKLFVTDELFVKVRINEKSAYVNGIYVEFDKDKFNVIDVANIGTSGMNLSDIKSVSPQFIKDTVVESGLLSIAIQSESKLGCWQYIVPGMQTIDYGGSLWRLADGTIATQHNYENVVIIKNVSGSVKTFKLEHRFFEDSIVVVGDKSQNETLIDVKEKVDVLVDESYKADTRLNILDQNVSILHDAIEHKTSGSWYSFTEEIPSYSEGLQFELPTYMLPTKLSVNLKTLSPGGSVELENIDNFYHVQLWDIKTLPVNKTIDYKLTKSESQLYEQSNGDFKSSYIDLAKIYDTNNTYFMSSSLTSNSYYYFYTADYSCFVSRSDGANMYAVNSTYPSMILNTYSDASGSYPWYYWSPNISNVVYSLPGENARWMDFTFTFNQETYIHSLGPMDFGGKTSGNSTTTQNIIDFTYQVTTIFLDYDGSNNWETHSSYKGMSNNRSIYIYKPVKKLRIRIEVPYSYANGRGEVGLKYVALYSCPMRYVHDDDAVVTPIAYQDTSTWNRISSVYSDATINGGVADIHYMFETNNVTKTNKLYWGFNGSSLVTKSAINYSNGMTLSQFNNLTEAQLKILLNYAYVKPIAVMHSDDGLYTPTLRSMRINYSEQSYDSVALVDPHDVVARYDKTSKKLIVTNTTSSTMNLKAVIS